MAGPLIAVVGSANPEWKYNPEMNDRAGARKAAEELGTELARQGARLLVYGGNFIEQDVVRGFVAGEPASDHSILMWYTKDEEPPPFAEEKDHARLFQRRAERGADWEIAFYRSVARADGVILIGGGNATKISGQVAIGSSMPILALATFGGSAKAVWDSLSVGEDSPNRDEHSLMTQPWKKDSAEQCIKALLAQYQRRKAAAGAPPKPIFSVLATILFLAALAIVPMVWGRNQYEVWMLFLAPVLAGAAGSAIRPVVDRARGKETIALAALPAIAIGLLAGGVAGVLFVTAQLTGNPELANGKVAEYASRSIPYALGAGFIAGLTADAVFGKLLGVDVVKTSGLDAKS